MNRIEKMLEARRLLKECGEYDTSIAGAIGEVYVEDVLGMEKAPRGAAGYDGVLNNRRVQVKTKERLRQSLAASYVAISNKNIGLADDLVVVYFLDDDSIKHFGPVEISRIHYSERDMQRRYTIKSIIEAISTSTS